MHLRPRVTPLVPCLMIGGLVASLAVATPALGAGAGAPASVSIASPGAPVSGAVQLSGSVNTGPDETTSVLYVVDATSSTGQVSGLSCADGGYGAEDLNGDGLAGDVLDCEIAGVLALNRSLASTTGSVQAGLVAFANQAAVADLDPAGSATFVPPAYTGGDPAPRLETVATSVQRNRIGLYDERDLGGSGSGTAFSSAVTAALTTLASAPQGPKWVMFLSDGQSGIDDAVLDALAGSGVRLRSFAIGSGATCKPSGSLYKMAAVTGESCRTVSQPASLAAEMTGSSPDAVTGVSVTIGGVAVAATLDAVGGWHAAFTLGAGTYTARARATFASGITRTAQRTFTVTSSGTGPAGGTVTPGPGSLRATLLRVARPAPSRAALPSRVKGRLGIPVHGLTPTRKLARSRVRLEATRDDGRTWSTVARGRADARGRFRLSWRPKAAVDFLRVVAVPPRGYASSVARVKDAKISACKVKGPGSGWTVTCRTTARNGSVVRLQDGGSVQDRAKVRKGTFRLHGRGPVAGTRIEVLRGKRPYARLKL